MQRATHNVGNDEAGNILPLAALLLIPLLVFAALATDVGAWTVHGGRLQHAADAAALAAAAQLPDEFEAAAAAERVAALNGFEDGVEGVELSITFPAPSEVAVSVKQPSELFFASAVVDTPFEIERLADAAALDPIHLSSPTNVLGFGPYSIDGSPVSNYWLHEGNDCTPAYYGDYRAAKNYTGGWCSSSGTERPAWKRRGTNPRQQGYFYLVKIPPGMTSPSQLMVFDPGQCPGVGNKPKDHFWEDGPDAVRGTRLSFQQWDTAGTAQVTSDDTQVGAPWTSTECARDLIGNTSTWTDKTVGWTASPFVFPANTSGHTETHLIQTMVDDSPTHGWNLYGFWVKPLDGRTSCSTITSDTCPSIGAFDFAPVAADGAIAGEPMYLYLAEVEPHYQGRVLRVKVWDTGEGMDNLQIIDPNGKALDFTWGTEENTYGRNIPADDCDGAPCLWLDPYNKNYPPPPSGYTWPSISKFNGRLAYLDVPLNDQVDFDSYPNYWFSVRFAPTPGARAKEWASMSVEMKGDPTRLTD